MTMQFMPTTTLTYTDVTVDQCANFCAQSDDSCQTFSYCANTTQCRLTSVHPKTSGATLVKDVCDLYISKQINPYMIC